MATKKFMIDAHLIMGVTFVDKFPITNARLVHGKILIDCFFLDISQLVFQPIYVLLSISMIKRS